MAIPKYNMTVKGVKMWSENELEHVGRILTVEDPDLQYSYALSTVNGMLHLRDALHELIMDPAYKEYHRDLRKTCFQVVRAIKHLIKDFKINLNTIRAFNTRKILSDLKYLNDKRYTSKSTRKARSTRRR